MVVNQVRETPINRELLNIDIGQKVKLSVKTRVFTNYLHMAVLIEEGNLTKPKEKLRTFEKIV